MLPVTATAWLHALEWPDGGGAETPALNVQGAREGYRDLAPV